MVWTRKGKATKTEVQDSAPPGEPEEDLVADPSGSNTVAGILVAAIYDSEHCYFLIAPSAFISCNPQPPFQCLKEFTMGSRIGSGDLSSTTMKRTSGTRTFS